MAPPLVAVVVNKWWELDHVIAALTSEYAVKDSKLGSPKLIDHPRKRTNTLKPEDPKRARPRVEFTSTGAHLVSRSALVVSSRDFGKHYRGVSASGELPSE